MDKKQRVDALIEMIARVDDPKAIRALFADICTAKELENMSERCYAARLLMEGKTYAQVMELSDISSATLSRVSRCVQYGEGYRNLLK